MLLSTFLKSLEPEEDILPTTDVVIDQTDDLEINIPRSSDCSVCPGLNFSELTSFRTHYQSDWHIYNIKAKQFGTKPLSDKEHHELLSNIPEATDDSDYEYASSSDDQDDDLDESQEMGRVGSSFLILYPTRSSTKVFKIYKNIVLSQGELQTRVDRDLSTLTNIRGRLEDQAAGTWIFLLIRSGRVAAAVYDNKRGVLVASKTFKRYTTRRKQGGSQASNDLAGGRAKSAGATIRRRNEQHLIEDVRGLFSEWKHYFSTCQLIFWNPTSTGRNCLFSVAQKSNGPFLLRQDDPRLRRVPFSTYRPTLDEVDRCYRLLSSVQYVQQKE
jgi:hypothetical protein